MPKQPDAFAARLALLMREAGLTAYRLSQLSGVSQQALSKLLAGSKPSWPTVCRLADGLGVSTEAFRGGG